MGQRCGRPDVEAVVETVAGPDGARLELSSVGRGETVALLLHQTGRSASCGWWPFANRMAENGIRAVMVDLCNFGRSTCDQSKPWSTDYVDQVVRVVAHVRSSGATRISLVGASLGGTVAAVSAGRAGVDAVADLSGFGFPPMVTGPALAALTIPLLGAGSHSEETESATLAAEVGASASRTKRFVWSDAGHGWTLVFDGPRPESPLSDVGRTVIAWARGDYAG